MIWQNSTYLFLLLLVLLMAGVVWWTGNRHERIRSHFFDHRLIRLLRRGFWKPGDRLRTACMFIAISLFIIGLAGPQIGTEVRDVQQRGVDLLVMLDLSHSMNAEDIRPSRLDKAKFEIQRLIDRSTGDRIGLLVFTGEAFVQSPMTLDHSALRMFLDIAETDQMPGGSTHFGVAFQKASETFSSLENQSGEAAKVILMFSDGEDHGSAYTEALETLTSSGVYVFTVGIGSAQGARIPVYERGTNRLTGYRQDDQGNEVITTLEYETLREIARLGNGSYYEINSSTASIDPFLARLDDLQQGEFAVREYADYNNRYQLLLIAGVLFFIAGRLVPDVRFGRGQ